jgi:hypothetical protein
VVLVTFFDDLRFSTTQASEYLARLRIGKCGAECFDLRE